MKKILLVVALIGSIISGMTSPVLAKQIPPVKDAPNGSGYGLIVNAVYH
jgi:hypothetical protein